MDARLFSRLAILVACVGSLLAAVSCNGDDDGDCVTLPPYGLFDEYAVGCIDDLLRENEGTAATISGAEPTLTVRSLLGEDSLVILGVRGPVLARDDVRAPWLHSFFEFNTSLQQDSLPTQRGSHFAVRATPRDYWFTGPPLMWVQLSLYAPVIDGSRGQGLASYLRQGKSLEVAVDMPFGVPEVLPELGAQLEYVSRCISSDAGLRPAPNATQSIVVSDFRSVPTAEDTTYHVTLDFDLEVYGARRLADDNLPWRGSVYFEYVEDRG